MNIRKVAQELGVSTATISRVLSESPLVTPATREHVLRGIEELGYVPNSNARRLSTGRSRTIGFQATARELLRDPYVTTLVSRLLETLQKRGYSLLIDAGDGRDLLGWAKTRMIDGVIVSGSCLRPASALPEFHKAGVPCVFIGSSPPQPAADVGNIRIDLASGAQQAAHALSGAGHHEIAFISNPKNHSDEVLAVFQKTLREAGVKKAVRHIKISLPDIEGGMEATKELLSLATPPTAVFARTDSIAIGVLREARRHHKDIPSQLAVIGHDDTPFAQICEPPLSTIRINCDELAEQATHMLLAMVENKTAQPPSTPCIANIFVVRSTCGTASNTVSTQLR